MINRCHFKVPLGAPTNGGGPVRISGFGGEPKKVPPVLRGADRPDERAGAGRAGKPGENRDCALAASGREQWVVGASGGSDDGHVGRVCGGGQGGFWGAGARHDRSEE